VLVVDAPNAVALTQNRITLSHSHQVFDADYPAIPGSFEESTSAVTPEPTDCGNPDGESDTDNPPTFGTMCDTIPLRVVVPTDIDPGDDFIISVALSWTDSPGKAVGNGQEGGVTDVDLHLFDNQQIEKRAGSTGYTEITASNGTAIPEVVKVCCPDLVDYNVVIANVGPGANTGYHIHAEMKILKADKIYELLADKPATHPASTDDNTLPADFSDVPAVAPGLGGLTLSDDFDGDLSQFANAPLETALQAPDTGSQTVRIEKPSDVSGMTLLLWLGALPVGLLGGAAGYWVRRRNAAGRLI